MTIGVLMLNNFLNILNLLKKECLVNRYEYTNGDKESIQKKYTIEDDEYFYLGNKQNTFNRKPLPINKHNEIFKLKSSSVSNIFKLVKEEKDSKYDYKKFTDDKYKFHGEGSDRYYSMDSKQEWLKEVIGNRTLIELEPKEIYQLELFQNNQWIKIHMYICYIETIYVLYPPQSIEFSALFICTLLKK